MAEDGRTGSGPILARRNVDIGDQVKAGDLLAELAVPELDDQISQNESTLTQLKSTLEQAEANLIPLSHADCTRKTKARAAK